MDNYYNLLEISVTASDEVIKAAYKALSRKYHPDNEHEVAYGDKMKQINVARDTLLDPVQRSIYDLKLKQFIESKANKSHDINNSKRYHYDVHNEQEDKGVVKKSKEQPISTPYTRYREELRNRKKSEIVKEEIDRELGYFKGYAVFGVLAIICIILYYSIV